MKLLITLLLLCIVGVYSQQKCFTEPLLGYSTGYSTTAFNSNTEEDGQVTQNSFSEVGTMSVNFYGKTLYNSVVFDNQQGTSVFVESYTFGSNNTQYIVIENKCYYHEFNASFPGSLPVVPVNSSSQISIGDIPVSQFEMVDQQSVSYSKDTLYVNSQSCAFMFSNSVNVGNVAGNAITVFVDYTPGIFAWNLPVSCNNASPINSKHQELFKSRPFKFF